MGDQQKTKGATASTKGVEVRKASVRLRFTDQTGFRHNIRLKDGGRSIKPTAGNIRAAERLLAAVQASIDLGTFELAHFFPENAPKIESEPAKTVPTLSQQLDTWLAGLTVAKSTRAGYEVAVKFWTSAPADTAGTPLADVPIDELVFSQIRHALAVGSSRQRRGKIDSEKPAKPLKPKTMNNYLACLRSALDLAVDDELIAKSPAGEGKRLRSRVQEPEPDPLSTEELVAIIDQIRKKDPAAADYCEFWGFGGYRTSEINGLHWDSVDLRSGHVRIHEVNVRGDQIDETKTKRARHVRLNPRALAALERQRARTQLAGAHVWLNPMDGRPWNDERAFRRSHWTSALRALGIRYRRPYQLRHTYATMLLQSGVNPSLAARQLGHSVATFFKHYARWIDAAIEATELAKVDAMAAAAPMAGVRSL